MVMSTVGWIFVRLTNFLLDRRFKAGAFPVIELLEVSPILFNFKYLR